MKKDSQKRVLNKKLKRKCPSGSDQDGNNSLGKMSCRRRGMAEVRGRERQTESLYCLVTHRKVKISKEEEYLNTTQQIHLCDRICNRITEYKRPHKTKSENKKKTGNITYTKYVINLYCLRTVITELASIYIMTNRHDRKKYRKVA
jgi:hypothetical protein